jgi:hypothetical protein
MNINLHIEHLVLENMAFPPHQKPLVQAAFEEELMRLLAEEGIAARFQTGSAIPNISIKSIQLVPGSNAQQIGKQIAQEIHGEIKK